MLHADLVGRAVFQKLCGLANFGDYSNIGAITPTKPVRFMGYAALSSKEIWKQWTEKNGDRD